MAAQLGVSQDRNPKVDNGFMRGMAGGAGKGRRSRHARDTPSRGLEACRVCGEVRDRGICIYIILAQN